MTSGPISVAASSGSPTTNDATASASASTASAWRARGTSTRVWAAHACPLFMNDAKRSPAAVRARSASSSTIAADLPPSSRLTRLSCRPQTAPISRPTTVEPVNVTLSTDGWATRWRPASTPPGRMLTTPGGKPQPSTMSASSRASIGDSGAGLTTTLHPASSAGTSLATMRIWGTFQAVIAATTPTGSRSTRAPPKAPGTSSSQPSAAAASTKPSISRGMAPTCPSWEKTMGDPFSDEMTVAISSSRSA